MTVIRGTAAPMVVFVFFLTVALKMPGGTARTATGERGRAYSVAVDRYIKVRFYFDPLLSSAYQLGIVPCRYACSGRCHLDENSPPVRCPGGNLPRRQRWIAFICSSQVASA
jgi:hypothetical protein